MTSKQIVTVFIAALMTCSAMQALAAPEKERYIVVFKPGKELDLDEEKRLGADVHYRLAGRIVISIPAAAAEALSKNPNVKYIQKSVMYEEGATPQVQAEAEAARRMPSASDASTITWTSGDYVYDGTGNIAAIGTDAAPGTGNRRSVYRYDGVSRLRTSDVATGTTTVAESFGYDIYGNMTSTSYQGVATTIETVATKNRLAPAMGAEYDKAGNLIAYGSEDYVWDPVNMMTTKYDALGTPEIYVYTADDERIGVLKGNDWVWSIRGFDGKVLRQYKGSSIMYAADWVWLKDYVYRGSQLLGSERVTEEGGRRHVHLDHLGTARVITNALAEVTSRHDYRPFGIETTAMNQDVVAGIDSEEAMDFTGHERDFTGGTATNNENYLDYMHARYYLPKWGRFLSVDPVIDMQVALKNPQGWNRYAYVRNNPLNKTDPTGKCEDPKPGSGGTRICIQPFIPTATFAGFVGDNRGPRSNGGTYRLNQSIMFNKDGKATAPAAQPGVSRLALAPTVVARKAEVAHSSVTQVAPGVVQARGAASDGLAFGAAPNLSYNLTISVDKNGAAAVTGGKHSGYPALEVWSYRDGQAPDLIYSYNPSRKDAFGGFLNISAVTVDVQSQVPSLDPDVP